MKKLFPLICLGLSTLTLPAQASSGTGVMTANVNRETGTQMTFNNNVTYENKQLRFESFGNFDNPITFDVDLTTGKVTAAPGQLALNVRDGDDEDDERINFFYSALQNSKVGISGRLFNNDDNTCDIVLDNWSATAANSNRTWGYLYYNCSVKLPFTIEGLSVTDEQTGSCKIMSTVDGSTKTWNSTATFNAKTKILTISEFGGSGYNPIQFSVRLGESSGWDGYSTAKAGQEAYSDGYVYTGNRQFPTDLVGTLENISNNQCFLFVQVSWFVSKTSSGSVKNSYSNTRVTIDFAIDGLPNYNDTKPEPKLTITDVTRNYADSSTVDYTVKVTSQDISGPITVYYQIIGIEKLELGGQVANGYANFKVTGLVEGEEYTIDIKAESGDTYSNTVRDTFTMPVVRDKDPIEGVWYFDMFSHDYNGNTLPEKRTDEKYDATLENGVVTFTWQLSSGHTIRVADFVGYYDEENGTITFPATPVVAKFNTRTLYQRGMVYNADGSWTIKEITATFNKETQKIYFGENEGLAWYDNDSDISVNSIMVGPIVFYLGYREGGNLPDPPKVKSITIDNVKTEVLSDTSVKYTYDVLAENFEEGAAVTSYYIYYEGSIKPATADWQKATGLSSGFEFTLENLKPGADYTVRFYAECEEVISNEWTETLHVAGNPDSSVSSINGDNGDARYFNLQGIEIAHPERGQLYIRVSNNEINKVIF